MPDKMYHKNRKVIFVEWDFLQDQNATIFEEDNGHYDLSVNAVCPLGSFGYELGKSLYFADYFSKRFLANNNRLILNRIMDLLEYSFDENNAEYVLVIGPPSSRDVIYPLIVDMCGVYNFISFSPNYKTHSFTIPIKLDFENAYGRFYCEFDQKKN
ncbi:MAG: hypothetical protein KBD48_03500 [Candidatus Pacebacteria bacterium]|nr:hypothetical protein [Candidatus Paceibacterota bacterium]